MLVLFLISFGIIAIDVVLTILAKKFAKTDRLRYWILLIASLLTVICHYSNFFIKLFQGENIIDYLNCAPNLIIPLYPCNIIMYFCVIFGALRHKENNFGKFLSDSIILFGIVSSLIGMFANVDFIVSGDLSDWEVTKSIVAHGFMLLNCFLLVAFGYFKISLPRNIINMTCLIIVMFLIGAYDTLIFETFVGHEKATSVNAMFLVHEPFGPSFLTFPFIAGVSLLLYFVCFFIMELFMYKKGNRWYNRIAKSFKKVN